MFFQSLARRGRFHLQLGRQTIKDNVFDKEITFGKDNVYKLKELYLNKEIGTTKKVLKQKLEKNQSLVLKIYK